MKHEVAVLNEYGELGGDIKFHIARLYMDDGVKFKGAFKQFCEEKGIWKYTF